MKKILVGLCLAILMPFAWAVPSVQEVDAAIKSGNYMQAEKMMSEVVVARPDSAKAHYTYAELLAHNTNFAKAAEEAARARQIDPKITFADPEKFRSFEQLLQREQSPTQRPRVASGGSGAPALDQATRSVNTAERSGIPGWIWPLGLAILGIVLWRAFAKSRAAPAVASPMASAAPGGNAFSTPVNPGAAYATPGPNAGYGNAGVPQQQGRPGSGLLGTGLAVAGGVAGGMLIDQMLHKRQDGSADNGGAHNFGGADNGSFGDSSSADAARELENRPIDMGSGDDWGGDAGSGDSGGGSGDGGGW